MSLSSKLNFIHLFSSLIDYNTILNNFSTYLCSNKSIWLSLRSVHMIFYYYNNQLSHTVWPLARSASTFLTFAYTRHFFIKEGHISIISSTVIRHWKLGDVCKLEQLPTDTEIKKIIQKALEFHLNFLADISQQSVGIILTKLYAEIEDSDNDFDNCSQNICTNFSTMTIDLAGFLY